MARAGRVKIRDRDRGYKRVRRQARNAGGRVDGGILEGQGASDRYPESGASVVEVGASHELGLGNPERSFIRATFDEDRDTMRRTIRDTQQQVLRGRATPEQALNATGARFVELMDQRILRGIAPPLAEATIEEKGSALPLVDSGLMRQTLSHRFKRAHG